MLVLGRTIVDVFGSADQGSQEDSVPRAGHALGDLGQPSSQSLQQSDGGDECRDLNVGSFYDVGDEVIESGQAQRDQLGIDIGGGDAGDRMTSSRVDLDNLTRVDDLVGLIREKVCWTPVRGCQYDSSLIEVDNEGNTYRSTLAKLPFE